MKMPQAKMTSLPTYLRAAKHLVVTGSLGLSLLLTAAAFAQGPANFSYDGVITDSSGNPLEAPNVLFKMTVYSPGTEQCVLWSEQQNLVMTGSGGHFTLWLGQGTPATGLTMASSLTAALSNSKLISSLSNCATGNSYTPNAGDSRKVSISFSTDGGTTLTTMSPMVGIGTSPYAMEADSLQGKGPSSFIQANILTAALSQANLEQIFASSTNVNQLLGLINGTTTTAGNTTFSGTVSFATTPTTSAAPTSGSSIVNKNYSDSTIAGKTADATMTALSVGDSGKILTWNGSQWTASAASAAVDSSKLPLAGGTLTGALSMSGQSINNAGYITMLAGRYLALGGYTNTSESTLVSGTLTPGGATYAGTTWYNTSTNEMKYWNGSTAVSVGSGGGGASFSNNGNSFGTAASIGTNDAFPLSLRTNNAPRLTVDLSGNVGIGTTAPGSALDVKGAIRMSGSVSGYSGFQSAAAAGSTVWTLPSADGINGQLLKTDGSGNLSWATAGAGGVTSVTAGTGLTGGTITSSGTIALANIATGTFLGNTTGSAASPTATTLSALMDNSITNNQGSLLYRNATGWVPLTPGTSGQVLTTAGAAANLAWTTPAAGTVTSVALTLPSIFTVAGSPVTASGTFSATLASQTANTFLAAPNGTSGPPAMRAIASNDLPTITVAKGGTGATSLTPNGLLLADGTGSSISSTVCSAGQTLISSGAGYSCQPVLGPTQAYINGGNSFSANATLGTNDGFTFGLKTNGATRMMIDAAGNVGIGTSAPSSFLHTVDATGKAGAFTGVLHAVQNVSSTASATKVGMDIESTGSWIGSGATNTGLVVNATGAATNYAALFNGGGSVGINTTAPVSLLQTTDTANKTAPYVGITHLVQNSSTTPSIGKVGMDIESTGAWTGTSATNTGLVVNVSGAPINVAASFMGGNVGIGTPSPQAQLDVSNGGNSLMLGADVGLNTRTDATQKSGRIVVPHFTNSQLPFAVLSGVAGSTTNSLIVGGNTTGTSTGATAIQFFTYSTSTATTGTERMRITSAGNLGIGTGAPAYPVDVVGDMNSSTALRIAGTQICTSAGCTASSDRRLKENILPLQNSLENILQLNGVGYDWINKEKYGSSHQIGLIAQDLEKVYPEVVLTDKKTGLKSVAYDHLVAPLIESIKVLNGRLMGAIAELAGLKNQLANLSSTTAAQAGELSRLKQENAQLKQENAAIRSWICAKDPSAAICH